MSVTIELAPETERVLREKAARKGQTLEEYVRRLAEEAVASPTVASEPVVSASDKTPEEWVAAWYDWVNTPRPVTPIADDSRESIYEGRGE